jgi:hypothetical protein
VLDVARRGGAEATVAQGVAEFPVEVPPGCEAVRVGVTPADGAGTTPEGDAGASGFEYIVGAAEGATPFRSVVVRDRMSGAPVAAARFFDASGDVTTDVYGDRFVVGGGEKTTSELRVHAAGYRPVLLRPGESDTLLLDPWYDGALAGKRVVLNAEGAPPRADDRGPLGLSGSYVNLQVVRYLEEYLTAAGARVQQARRTEETPTDRDVVLVTNRFRAEVYVEVRYRRGSVDSALVVKTFYYPGSVRGAVVAGVVGSALGRALGVSAVPPAEKVTFPLQQTACPAIVVEPPSLGSLDEERRLSEPWYQRKQAYAMFGGLLANAGVTNTAALHVSLPNDSSAFAPFGGRSSWLVVVDDTWRLLTSPEGSAVFDWLPAGVHQIVIRRGDVSAGPYEVDLRTGETRAFETGIPLSR